MLYEPDHTTTHEASNGNTYEHVKRTHQNTARPGNNQGAPDHDQEKGQTSEGNRAKQGPVGLKKSVSETKAES